MPREWTEAQRRAIETLDADVCVAAGAGSGKTGVLTERFVRIVRGTVDGSLPEAQRAGVEQILVFTFTDKATREMKARIVAELTALGLHEQRRAVETAYLSTMHGFCSRLLKENPFEAGIDPEYEVLDETQARRLLRGCFRSAVEEGFAGDDEDIVELVSAVQEERVYGVAARDTLGALAESVERVMGRVRESGKRRPDLQAMWDAGRERDLARSMAPVEALLAPIVNELRAAADALRPLRGAAAGGLELARREVVRLIDRISLGAGVEGRRSKVEDEGVEGRTSKVERGTGDVLGLIGALREVRQACSKKARAMSPADLETAAALERVRFAVERAKELFAYEGDRERTAEELTRRFWRLLLATWAAYDEAKRERAVLDQTDLQAEAVHLLEVSPAVRRRYQRRFRHLLVDEFQDTNPIQLRLIQLLHEGRPDGVPRSCLFVVGDEQQSIYGFRGADERIFAATVRQFRRSPSRAFVPMVRNYRSRGEVVGFVNALFERIGAAGGTEFRALEAGGDYAPVEGPCVEMLVSPPVPRATYPQLEAEALARHIGALVAEGAVRLTDRRSRRLGERLRYGDCAVLFRSLSSITAYEDAFARAGIPFYVVGGGRGYYARREVRDILNVLSALDTPTDDLALAATLRSPMFGVSMDALAALHEIGEGRDEERPRGPLCLSLKEYLVQAPPESADAEAVRAFVELTERLRGEADRLTVGAILERIVAATNYDAKLLVRRDGRRRLANVRKLLWMAHAAPDRRVSEFVRALREIEKLAEREGDAPTEEEAADVVRFITIHKSKGLEFPVVYVADLDRSLGHTSDGLFECDASVPAVACRMGEYKSVAYRAIAQARSERELAEAYRVLYVAMTRARERLVLSGCVGRRGRGATWAEAVFGHFGLVKAPSGPQELRVCEGVRVRVAPLPTEPSAP